MSEVPTQAQDQPTEAMVEAAARAMRAAAVDVWDELTEDGRSEWRRLARVALIAGIAAALEKGR